MALDPIKFTFGLSDFPGYLNTPKDKLHKTISSFFSGYFKDIGGETTVDIYNDYIIVQWFPNSISDAENAIQSAVNLLGQGELSQGRPCLLHSLKDSQRIKSSFTIMGCFSVTKGKWMKP
jgi:hypothetical protein